MSTVSFRVGKGIGKILLEISQEDIVNGNPEKAIENYTKCFGMNKSHALQILHNQLVVEAEDDGTTVSLTDNENTIKENASNIYDWQTIMNTHENNLREMRSVYYDICKEFNMHCNSPIYDVNITEVVERYFGKGCAREGIGIHNIAAHLIGWGHLGKGISNGENIWENLVGNVESDKAENYEYALYFIVKYVELMKNMFDEYIKFSNTYKFLIENDFIKHISLVENNIENVLEILDEFCSPNTGYYHPMCDEELFKLKDKIIVGILTTEWGKEYLRYGILKKNIDDGYDAGWLSPDGDFYGGMGGTSAMIHMNLADKMFKKLLDKDVLKKKEHSLFGGTEDPEQYLTKHGWMKIHHNEIYGTFMHDPDGEYSYCPTEKQISEICRYADIYYNGNIYTHPQIVRSTDPISTYKLRQMDKFKLNEIFSI